MEGGYWCTRTKCSVTWGGCGAACIRNPPSRVATAAQADPPSHGRQSLRWRSGRWAAGAGRVRAGPSAGRLLSRLSLTACRPRWAARCRPGRAVLAAACPPPPPPRRAGAHPVHGQRRGGAERHSRAGCVPRCPPPPPSVLCWQTRGVRPIRAAAGGWCDRAHELEGMGTGGSVAAKASRLRSAVDPPASAPVRTGWACGWDGHPRPRAGAPPSRWSAGGRGWPWRQRFAPHAPVAMIWPAPVRSVR